MEPDLRQEGRAGGEAWRERALCSRRLEAVPGSPGHSTGQEGSPGHSTGQGAAGGSRLHLVRAELFLPGKFEFVFLEQPRASLPQSPASTVSLEGAKKT